MMNRAQQIKRLAFSRYGYDFAEQKKECGSGGVWERWLLISHTPTLPRKKAQPTAQPMQKITDYFKRFTYGAANYEGTSADVIIPDMFKPTAPVKPLSDAAIDQLRGPITHADVEQFNRECIQPICDGVKARAALWEAIYADSTPVQSDESMANGESEETETTSSQELVSDFSSDHDGQGTGLEELTAEAERQLAGGPDSPGETSDR